MTASDLIAELKARIIELETALARRTSEWTDTVDAMSDWVCIIDQDFRILRTNRAVESFLGLKREDVLGKTCYRIVHGTDTHIDHCPVPKMMRSLRRAQTEVQLGDGRWLSVTVDPLTAKSGRLVGAVHMVRDITALRMVQAEREALIRNLEQALSEVKTLKGLIPICARCRRIRDDSGAWSSLEAYVRSHLDTDFSHGLCPECAQAEREAYDL
jgi:PAS domain S-box-containing protein